VCQYKSFLASVRRSVAFSGPRCDQPDSGRASTRRRCLTPVRQAPAAGARRLGCGRTTMHTYTSTRIAPPQPQSGLRQEAERKRPSAQWIPFPDEHGIHSRRPHFRALFPKMTFLERRDHERFTYIRPGLVDLDPLKFFKLLRRRVVCCCPFVGYLTATTKGTKINNSVFFELHNATETLTTHA
jgi:hypothetical protein